MEVDLCDIGFHKSLSLSFGNPLQATFIHSFPPFLDHLFLLQGLDSTVRKIEAKLPSLEKSNEKIKMILSLLQSQVYPKLETNVLLFLKSKNENEKIDTISVSIF